MKEAIKLAIEGGYKLPNLKDETATLLMALAKKEKTLLDPFFWQALGKAEGWIAPPKGQAYFYQHRFITHLAEGKDVDSFFADLLSK